MGFSNKGKIGITVMSFGGYSSWLAITKAPLELIAAAAPISGMTDLITDYETMRPDLQHLTEEMMGGNPTDVPDVYYNRSPINFIKDIKGKLMIIHGKQDANVSIKNVEVAIKYLEKFGKEYDLLIFEDEGHGINKRKNRMIMLEEIAKFFEKTL